MRIAIAGASGALGKEILAALEAAPWKADEVVALGRATTETPSVNFGDEELPVDDLEADALDGFDLVFLALPIEAALKAGERAAAAGVAVVDLSGAFGVAEDVPRIIPWVNLDALGEVERGIASVPSAASILIASVLGPLARAGIAGPAEATVMLPASDRGRAGIDELSRQVVSLFNAGTPPRKVFPDGLAFDLLPQVGRMGENGWTDREQLVQLELADMLGLEALVTLVGVPVFSGISAHLRLRPTRRVLPELVERVLTDAGLQLPRQVGPRWLPRPRRVEGSNFPQVGRVRIDPEGDVLHLWASMDNLRVTAVAAVGLAGSMLRVQAEPMPARDQGGDDEDGEY